MRSIRALASYYYCNTFEAQSSSYFRHFSSYFIHNDAVIDKMAMFSVGTSYVITKISFVCGFYNMELMDNKGKKLVTVMWRCEIVQPDKTRLKFDIDAKPCAFVL